MSISGCLESWSRGTCLVRRDEDDVGLGAEAGGSGRGYGEDLLLRSV